VERVTEGELVRPHGRRKRSIRTKLLVLLLVISIVPMFIALAIGQLSTRLVGNRLTHKTQQQLEADASARLLQSTRAAARLAGSEAQQINLLVFVQAQAAADALEEARRNGKKADLSTIWRAREDFDQGARPVPGLTKLEDGRTATLEAPSFVFAPGTDPTAHLEEIAALQSMGRLLPVLNKSNPGLIHYQYAATASGIHASFPGHGGFPEGYDPRERPWYETTLANMALNSHGPGAVEPDWGQPLVDATTGNVVVSVAMPFFWRDGTVAGVTAVDMVLRNLLRHFQSEPAWTKNERLMIVLMPNLIEEGASEPVIWAQQSYTDEATDWQSPVTLDPFRLDDSDVQARMIAQMGRGESGVVRTQRAGQDVMCAYAPVFASGTNTGVMIISTVPYADVVALAESIDDEFWGIIFAQLRTNAMIAGIVIAAVVLIALRGSRTVTQPIRSLAETVDRVAKGDLGARADVKTRDELEELADDFNSMIPKLTDRMKLRESLDLAMQVQQSLLPKSAPVFPGFDIEGRSVYCDETGGDYFDYLLIDRENGSRLAVAMGDVTGHGIAAALLMTTARALVRARAGVPGSLAEHITQINSLLSADNAHGRFLTLFFLIVDREQSTMRYVAAGHDPAVIYNPADDTFRELDGEGGIPLGIDGSWQYEEHDAPIIRSGEVLFLGTDGIWEARDANDKLFGKDRMKEVIRANAHRSSKELCDAMLEAVRAYRGDVPQLDDITMVAMKAV